MSYGPDVPAPASTSKYVANEIILYGIRLNNVRNYGELDLTERPGWQSPSHLFSLRLELFRQQVLPTPMAPGSVLYTEVAIAAIYGYAYEGQCYRLDKQRIMAFYFDGADRAAVGCGYDETALNPQSYRMWSITTKTPIIELTASADLAENLILEANLPGKRAPNVYSSKMQLAHRGGRLTNS